MRDINIRFPKKYVQKESSLLIVMEENQSLFLHNVPKKSSNPEFKTLATGRFKRNVFQILSKGIFGTSA
jgi:hypothetical protein